MSMITGEGVRAGHSTLLPITAENLPRRRSNGRATTRASRHRRPALYLLAQTFFLLQLHRVVLGEKLEHIAAALGALTFGRPAAVLLGHFRIRHFLHRRFIL